MVGIVGFTDLSQRGAASTSAGAARSIPSCTAAKHVVQRCVPETISSLPCVTVQNPFFSVRAWCSPQRLHRHWVRPLDPRRARPQDTRCFWLLQRPVTLHKEKSDDDSRAGTTACAVRQAHWRPPL